MCVCVCVCVCVTALTDAHGVSAPNNSVNELNNHTSYTADLFEVSQSCVRQVTHLDELITEEQFNCVPLITEFKF